MLTKIRPILPVYHYYFVYRSAGAIQLPRYPGSAWRGALGHALKRAVCVIRDTPCSACLLKSSCAYSYIFETPPPPQTEKMRKYNASPHPFVLRFPSVTASSDYILELILFGHGQRYFPYLVHALSQAGETGIGGKRQKFMLDRIVQHHKGKTQSIIYQNGEIRMTAASETIKPPPLPERIDIQLHTPLRVKQKQHNLRPEQFHFAAFFGSLLRRVSMLTYFHSDTPLETDFATLMQLARRFEFNQKKLQWQDWERYSSRQKTAMKLGGVTGSVSLNLMGGEALWPYLWLGQWTHAGKATSMGLGYYTIHAANLPDKA